MSRSTHRLALGVTLGALLLLAGCGGDDDAAPVTPPVVVPPVPAPTTFNVSRCLNQLVAPGVSVASLVVPDTLTVSFQSPSGFPNGRRLTDPVIDVTLAVLFLDLTKHPATVLASVPVNPPANDLPFRAEFPYLAAPQGNPPIASGIGANYDFRTDPDSAYVRVDRMGFPAVATVLISTAKKTEYNDNNPSDDATGKFVPEITATLTGLTNALADDFTKLGLSICATPG